MKRHLQEDEICRWLAGERSAEALEHVAGCAQCQAELSGMGEALEGLQKTARTEGAQRMAAYDSVWSRGVRALVGSEGEGWTGLRWAGAFGAAAAAICVALTLWIPRHEARPAAPPATSAAVAASAAQSGDDAALLKRVDAELSRTIPGPMEPLTKLIDYPSEAEGR